MKRYASRSARGLRMGRRQRSTAHHRRCVRRPRFFREATQRATSSPGHDCVPVSFREAHPGVLEVINKREGKFGQETCGSARLLKPGRHRRGKRQPVQTAAGDLPRHRPVPCRLLEKRDPIPGPHETGAGLQYHHRRALGLDGGEMEILTWPQSSMTSAR